MTLFQKNKTSDLLIMIHEGFLEIENAMANTIKAFNSVDDEMKKKIIAPENGTNLSRFL